MKIQLSRKEAEDYLVEKLAAFTPVDYILESVDIKSYTGDVELEYSKIPPTPVSEPKTTFLESESPI